MELEKVLPEGFSFSKEYNTIYGDVNGYQILIYPLESEQKYRVTMTLDVEQSTYKSRFLTYIQTLETRYAFVENTLYNGRNKISLDILSENEKDREKIDQLLKEIATQCEICQLHTCCETCGKTGELDTVAFDGNSMVMCGACKSALTASQEQNVQKENVPLGIIGALAGALIGSVVWVLIGQVGFIAGIAGYLIIFCSVKGYEMLGKNLSKRGIILCVIFSLLAIAAAEYVSLGLTIYKELKADYLLTLPGAFALVPEFLTYSEVTTSVIKDLVVGYGLAAWASYSFIGKLWRFTKEKTVIHTVTKL